MDESSDGSPASTHLQPDIFEGVHFDARKIHTDERGSVLHHFRNDSPQFKVFGEVYGSTVLQNRVKAWTKHHRVTQNLVVPIGMVRFVVYDDREKSATCGQILEIMLGREKYGLLSISPGLWHGFQCVPSGGRRWEQGASQIRAKAATASKGQVYCDASKI